MIFLLALAWPFPRVVASSVPDLSPCWVVRKAKDGPEIFLRLANLSPSARGLGLTIESMRLSDGFRVESIGVVWISALDAIECPAGSAPAGETGELKPLRLDESGPWRVTAVISTTEPGSAAVSKLSLVVGKTPERMNPAQPRKVSAPRGASHGPGPKRKGRCFMASNIDRAYRLEVRRPFAVKGDGFRHILTKGTVFQARMRTYHRGGIEVADLKLEQCGQSGAPGAATAVPCGSIRFAEDSAKPEGRASGA